MRYKRHVVPLLLALCQGSALAAGDDGAKPAVRWMTVDLPPLFMVSGAERGLGDYAQGLAVAHLDEYTHVAHTLPPNYQRIEQAFKDHDDVCFAGFLKTPARERFMVFSDPYTLVMPAQLFVPPGHAHLPMSEQEVDLHTLLAAGDFRLGVLGGRRYGPAIDPVLDAYEDSTPVYRRYAKDQLAGLVNMMVSRDHSLDGLLATPGEIDYLKRTTKAGAAQLQGYAIAGSPPFLFGYFACSRSVLGHAVIAGINRALPDIRAHVAQFYAQRLNSTVRDSYTKMLQDQWGIGLTAQ
jgi:uncharacterized protein (TIGR02285 family)